MIFQGSSGLDRAWEGMARRGTATRHPVRQLGQFLGPGEARRGEARLGKAKRLRWAVSPETFVGNKQGNQSKTT